MPFLSKLNSPKTLTDIGIIIKGVGIIANIECGFAGNFIAIDIPQAATGIYFIEIRAGAQVGTRRFVKQ